MRDKLSDEQIQLLVLNEFESKGLHRNFRFESLKNADCNSESAWLKGILASDNVNIVKI